MRRRRIQILRAEFGSLIYYRPAGDVFDNSVGKIKAILLRVSPVVRPTESKPSLVVIGEVWIQICVH